MNSIVLIANPEVSLERVFSLLKEKWTPYSNSLGKLVIEGDPGPVFVYADQRIGDDYGEAERTAFESTLSNPRFFMIDYEDVDLAKKVALYLSENLEVLIDLDTGAAPMSGEVFAHHVREDPDWDWHAKG